ncbi:MAG TPA: hypothetical protein VEJ46_06205, partial [Candidatus Acidoferrum sp.]|nr:hypothetical protein [Candidatus Acidoferrum sp.]
MRTKIFVVLESVFLGLGVLVLVPSANPAASARVSNPSQMTSSPLSNPATNSKTNGQQPLAVWECMTSWYGEDFDGLPTATGETYDMYG